MPFVAAVVYDDNIVKALGKQAVHDLKQFFVRLIGGDDGGDFHVRINLPLSESFVVADDKSGVRL